MDPAGISYSAGTIFLAVAVASVQDATKYAREFLASAPLRQLGIWSYSLYLWQQPFYKSIGTVPTEWLFAAALASGLLSFYFVEAPLELI